MNKMNLENVEDYLRKHVIVDGYGNMDGSFVPLNVAMIAIKQCLDGEMEYRGRSWVKNDKDSIINNINKELTRLNTKYPVGEFLCSPMYSRDRTLVSCVVGTDWKSNMYYFESNPVEELLEFLQKIN